MLFPYSGYQNLYDGLSVVIIPVMVLRFVTPCTSIGDYKRFGSTCCLYLEDCDSIFIIKTHYVFYSVDTDFSNVVLLSKHTKNFISLI
jgi:hypothetical protein